MYLWRVEKLIEDFRNENVTEKEKFKYMLLFGAVITVGADPIVYIGSKYSIMDAINLFVMLIVVLGGTYYCYAANRDADNKDFVTRFLCIGVPIMIRIFVVALPIFIVIAVVESIYGVGVEISESGEEVYSKTVSQVVFGILLVIIYYLYLGNKIKSIASDRNA